MEHSAVEHSSCCIFCQSQSTRHAWRDLLFSMKEKDIKVGQRLGLPYIRSMQPTLEIQLPHETFSLAQDGTGVMAISGVVWDCGLLMVDFLATIANATQLCDIHKIKLDHVMDIGCGTGICGISASKLGAKHVVFTDVYQASSLEVNLELLPDATFIPYSWNEVELPLALKQVRLGDDTVTTWDCLLCSDLLYDAKHHEALLTFLQNLQFTYAFFAYKMRHDQAELQFFEQLSTWCHIDVVDTLQLSHFNLTTTALQGSGLFLAIVSPKTSQP